MGAQAEQVAVQLQHIERQKRGRLHGVGMKFRPARVSDFGDLPDRLNRADFVVGVHHGNKCRCLRHRFGDGFGPHDSGFVRLDESDRIAALLKPVSGMENRVMLDFSGDEMIFRKWGGQQGSENGEVVAFGSAAGEIDLGKVSVEQGGDPLSGLVENGTGFASLPVDTGGVAESSAQNGQHFVQHFGGERSGGRIIQVERGFCGIHGVNYTARSAFPERVDLQVHTRKTTPLDETAVRLRARDLRAALDADNLPTPAALLHRAFASEGLALEELGAEDNLLAGAYGVLQRNLDCVFLRENLPLPLKHFILAHELAHVLLHPEYAEENYAESDAETGQLSFSMLSQTAQIAEGYSPAERREREANLFAAEFLLPCPLLQAAFEQDNLKASDFAERFQVSLPLVYSQLAQALLLPTALPTADLSPLSSDLSPSQKAAAETLERVTLVDAGPGTGKTRTLIARIGWLVERQNVPPEQILALTYTNRAAEEMRSRLFRTLGDRARRVWVGTYHAFGYELLKKEAAKLGLPVRPTLLDAADAALRLEEVHFQLGLSQLHYPHDPALVYGELLDAFSRAKDELISPPEFKRRADVKAAQAQTEDEAKLAKKWQETASAYAVYGAHLQKTGSLDFGDLLMRPLQLFEQFPDTAKQWSEQYRHVLADEYQDVNLASVRLLQAFAKQGSTLWVVGDSRQAIYRFRGASPRNIADFEEDFGGGQRCRLTGNYRSLPPLLELVNQSADAIQPKEPDWKPWKGERSPPNPPAPGLSEQEPAIFWHEAEDEAEETAHLIQQIRRLQRAGVPLEEQVVLVFKNKTRHLLASELEQSGIPVQHVGSLFDRPEIKDLLALLEFVSGTNDAAFRRVAALARYALLPEEAAQVFAWADPCGDSQPIASLLPNAQSLGFISLRGAARCLTLAQDLAGWSGVPSAWHLLCDFLFQKSDFLFRFAAGGQERLAIFHLLAFAHGVQMGVPTLEQKSPLSGFLVYLRRLLAMSESRSRRFSLAEGTASGIQLLTMHSAKGLEFRAVHLPGLDEDLFRTRASAQFVRPFPFLGEAEGEQNSDQLLLFVALSRAQDYLSLSAPRTRRGKPKGIHPLFAPLLGTLARYRTDSPASAAERVLSPIKALQADPASAAKPFLSYFALKQYGECPRLYYYEHELRLPAPSLATPYQKSHRVLRRLLQSRTDPEAPEVPFVATEITSHFAALWHEEFPVSTPETEALKRELEPLLLPIETVLQERAALPQGRWVTVPLTSGTFRVSADHLELRENGVLLFEKYHFRPRKKDDHLDPQLTAFRKAAEAEGRTAAVRLRYFGLSEDFEPIADKRAERNRREEFERSLTGIARGEFPPQPKDESLCRTCPFLFVCPT